MIDAGDREAREASERAARVAARPTSQPIPRQVVVNLNVQLHVTPGEAPDDQIIGTIRAIGEAIQEHLLT